MVGLLAATIGLVKYNIEQTEIRSKEIAIRNVTILLQAQQKFSLPEGSSYTPTDLDDATLVSVIAKNQPSVVRLGMIYCADITLANATVFANFADNCSGKVGSGSFISSDGYIATSGHVASVTPVKSLVNSLKESGDIARYLNYLVSTRLMTAREANTIKAGLDKDDSDARAALEASASLIPETQVQVANSTTQYAVQLSKDPIAVDRTANRLTFEYSDTVITATFVDQDYDEASSDKALTNGQFTSSDVALLKAKTNSSFPYIPLGSIDTLKVGDQLTAIGFPSAINGVSSDLTQTVPSITQGKVKDIRFDSSDNVRKIIGTSVQIGQGNSGGPALNDQGEQVGLNTYSIIECPNLDCYGDGQVRDVADLKALLQKNNITLKTGGVIDDWTRALAAYTKGNYEEALTYLTKVQDEYPANYLVSSLLNVAKQQVGTPEDTSTSYKAQGLVAIALATVVVLMVVVTIVLIALIVVLTRKHHRDERRAQQSA